MASNRQCNFAYNGYQCVSMRRDSSVALITKNKCQVLLDSVP